MKIPGMIVTESLKSDSFFDDMWIEVNGDSLTIRKDRFHEPLMEAIAKPDYVGPYRHLERLGIMDWPYEVDGRTIHPYGVGSPAKPDSALERAYWDVNFDAIDPGDNDIQDTLMARVAASKAARKWARAIDFEALHAFDGVYIGSHERANGYRLIVGKDVASQALRQFVLEYPILAALACDSLAATQAAEACDSVEDGYRRIITMVTSQGFPAGYYCPRVGPLPAALLDRMRGFAARAGFGPMSASLRLTAELIERARGLPPEMFPDDACEFRKLLRETRRAEMAQREVVGPRSDYLFMR